MGLAALAVAVACGSRTPLDGSPPLGVDTASEDGGDANAIDDASDGEDARVDGGVDASVRDAGRDAARDAGHDADAARDSGPPPPPPPPPPECYQFVNHATHLAVSAFSSDGDDSFDSRYDQHGCALRDDGVVCCWGTESFGELGNGYADDDEPRPVFVEKSIGASYPAGLYGHVTAISAGRHGTCALRDDRSVWCWGLSLYSGNGDAGQLDPVVVPVRVPGISDAVALSVGTQHACVVRAGGTVACWGDNTYGQIGIGSPSYFQAAPADVPGLAGVTAVSCGEAHTCAVLQDGTATCWGRNVDGEVGNGSLNYIERSPTAVVSVTDVTAIAAGGVHTCALHRDGQVSCWGRRARSGAGGTLTPELIAGINDAVSVAAGYYHACAIRMGGGVSCWGDNRALFFRGVLGDGSRVLYSLTPVDVVGLAGVREIRANTFTTCALSTVGIACWGFGAFAGATPARIASFR